MHRSLSVVATLVWCLSCSPCHETWANFVVWTQQGITKVLFGVKEFHCGVHTGSGDFVISTHDHLQFASTNRAWVIDFSTCAVRGMCGYWCMFGVFDWLNSLLVPLL